MLNSLEDFGKYGWLFPYFLMLSGLVIGSFGGYYVYESGFTWHKVIIVPLVWVLIYNFLIWFGMGLGFAGHGTLLFPYDTFLRGLILKTSLIPLIASLAISLAIKLFR